MTTKLMIAFCMALVGCNAMAMEDINKGFLSIAQLKRSGFTHAETERVDYSKLVDVTKLETEYVESYTGIFSDGHPIVVAKRVKFYGDIFAFVMKQSSLEVSLPVDKIAFSILKAKYEELSKQQ